MSLLRLVGVLLEDNSRDECPECGQYTLPTEHKCPDCIDK